MLTPRIMRTAVAVVVLLVALPLLWRPATPAQEAATRAVDAIVVPVADLERAVNFYAGVLSFERLPDTRSHVARMRLGREIIELVELGLRGGRPVPADSRSNDRWFQHIAIVVSDIEQAYPWLRRHHVEGVSPEPQQLPEWNPSAGGIWAFYFKDPDGHPLEILNFPPDKGAARWQEPSDKIFLGIDHTAIVVGDTEASLRLYRDLLGLKVVGHSDNHGVEQERLNNVPGARLRVTTLRADRGPGIELLEYLAPRDGRPLPADTRLNDLVAWRTVMTVVSPNRLVPLLPSAGARLVSSGGAREAIVVRDPDGHALQLHGR